MGLGHVPRPPNFIYANKLVREDSFPTSLRLVSPTRIKKFSGLNSLSFTIINLRLKRGFIMVGEVGLEPTRLLVNGF